MPGMDRTTGRQLGGNPEAENAHLAQSIGDILTTPIGSRVMLRDYGSMLFDLIDQPLTAATRLLVYAASAAAIRRWEPRIRAKTIGFAADAAEPGQMTLTIEGERADLPAANSRVILSIPIRTGGVSPVGAN